MAGKGGYQAPAHPAPVSLPGSGSSRTDGGPGKQPIRTMPDAAYGQNRDFVAQQQAAPLPQQNTATAPSTSQLASAMTPKQARQAALAPPGKDFMGPSNQPETPVTDGAALGPGRGPEALFQNSNAGTVQAVLAQLAPLDQSGAVQALMAAARAQGA